MGHHVRIALTRKLVSIICQIVVNSCVSQTHCIYLDLLTVFACMYRQGMAGVLLWSEIAVCDLIGHCRLYQWQHRFRIPGHCEGQPYLSLYWIPIFPCWVACLLLRTFVARRPLLEDIVRNWCHVWHVERSTHVWVGKLFVCMGCWQIEGIEQGISVWVTLWWNAPWGSGLAMEVWLECFMCGGVHYGEVEGLVSVERWCCSRGASCVAEYAMGRWRDCSL